MPDDNQQSVIAFLRRDAKGKMIMVVCNFNPIERVDYQMGVPNPGTYKELLNSDDVKYGAAVCTTRPSVPAKSLCMALIRAFSLRCLR